VKVNIHSGDMTGVGTVNDDAPTMDRYRSRALFGVECRIVHDDGSEGRFVDPTHVKCDLWWMARLQPAPTEKEWIAAVLADFGSFGAPCEALASRDPGQVRA
jgi:hypothetical protein